VAVGLLMSACSSHPQTPAQASASASASASVSAARAAADLKITPANGSRDVNPAAGITVTATKGKVTNVTVSSSGGTVAGTLRDGDRVWHSTWTLGLSQRYTVTATGTDGSGQQVTTTSTFRTLTPAATFSTEIYEGSGQTYGVGMPIMLIFSQPITNRTAVERSLRLTTSNPVIGAWYWDGSEHLDFRPRDYWPADTTVSFDGHLNGVQGAPGVYGAADLTQTFSIGESIISVASTTTHRTQIYINGKLTYTWPISTGRASLPTPDGTYLSVEKNNPVRMIGGTPGTAGYYNELVNWAVRFTFSGDYYHSAPWSVVDQGTSNVSHGCVNLPPEDAVTYYNLSIPGDPITVTSSTAGGKWDDGWTEWFLPWSQFLKGSALGEAVQAGPQGSQFVSPSALPADTATAPLATSAAGNYFAGSANIG
jgi:lipoprotein-anchoring transpeptidase ErfK/SrfK